MLFRSGFSITTIATVLNRTVSAVRHLSKMSYTYISTSRVYRLATAQAPAQRAELDWLLYNKPLEYAQMVLRGEIERYLSLGCDHGRLED